MDLSVRYSAIVDAKLKNELVLKDGVIFNNRYDGSAKAGAVKVRKSGTATVSDYNKTTGVEPTQGSSEWINVPVDKDKAVNEIIDGYDAAAIPDGIIADRLDTAGYGLANQLDADGAAALVAGGTVINNQSAYTSSTIYDGFVDMRKRLTKAGVPQNGRYALVSPETYAIALKSSEFIAASALGDKVKATGAVGSIAGFNVYESNNLGTNVEAVFGHPDYATRVKEWSVPVHVQALSGNYIGASAVQGRSVYAHKVTNADAIIVKVAPALSSIAVTTAPTTTTYEVGDVLDLDGMVVTATYSDSTTAAVTDYTTDKAEGATLATTDTSFTVSYTENGVTKTATQSITVS